MYDLLELGTMDYVINGKFTEGEEHGQLLIEIIRVMDGAHIWVTRYDRSSEWGQITKEIYGGFIKETQGSWT